ncbi:MAG: hypothetical protein R3292_08940 [Alcanivorax sp.]|nr:hypothetical protein [Alcanivorax sp.]
MQKWGWLLLSGVLFTGGCVVTPASSRYVVIGDQPLRGYRYPSHRYEVGGHRQERHQRRHHDGDDYRTGHGQRYRPQPATRPRIVQVRPSRPSRAQGAGVGVQLPARGNGYAHQREPGTPPVRHPHPRPVVAHKPVSDDHRPQRHQAGGRHVVAQPSRPRPPHGAGKPAGHPPARQSHGVAGGLGSRVAQAVKASAARTSSTSGH